MPPRKQQSGYAATVTRGLLLVLGAVALMWGMVALTRGGGSTDRRLYAVVPEASQMIPGQEIRSAGQSVGRVGPIEPVRGGRAARVELRFDKGVWPVPRGSRLTLRWGGTVSYSNRYVDLKRAAAGPALANESVLPAGAFAAPVEFDSAVDLFTRRMRRDTRSLVNTAGATFDAAQLPLRDVLTSAPPVVEEAGNVFADLTHDDDVLQGLLQSANAVTASVDRANPGVGPLLGGAGTTFRAIADQSRALEQTLDRLTPSLRQTRTTLTRADSTLDATRHLTARIAPGVTQLRRIARPLSRVLTTVEDIGPDARSTLASARRATPSLNPLLSKATALMPTVESAGAQAVHELKCIRPYTPEIVSLFSNWGDFFSFVDNKDKMARVILDNIVAAPSNISGYDSETATKLFPGLQYAFPRPPGLAGGQPWFLPECGAGPDALDPSKDPEAKR